MGEETIKVKKKALVEKSRECNEIDKWRPAMALPLGISQEQVPVV